MVENDRLSGVDPGKDLNRKDNICRLFVTKTFFLLLTSCYSSIINTHSLSSSLFHSFPIFFLLSFYLPRKEIRKLKIINNVFQRCFLLRFRFTRNHRFRRRSTFHLTHRRTKSFTSNALT